MKGKIGTILRVLCLAAALVVSGAWSGAGAGAWDAHTAGNQAGSAAGARVPADGASAPHGRIPDASNALNMESGTEGNALSAADMNRGNAEGEPMFTLSDLFVSGTEGYHTFRIPALYTTMNGTLLAFAEGRVNSASDTGDIDLVLKRSFDLGKTWEPLQVICDMGEDTCGNPTVVQDETTGRIWLFMTHNYGEDDITEINNGTSRGVRTFWSSYSDDDGATWSEPVNRFSEVQPPDTRWDATGPGIGIQLRHGPAKGRLVIPAIGRNIESDDHGATWRQSGPLPPGLNEATVVELTDGRLMRNDRLSDNKHIRRRGISISHDQGATWSPIRYDETLIDPIVEASIVRYMPSDNTVGNRMLLFANPASTQVRENMTVRISEDDGETWSMAKTVYKGPSAYSSLTVLPDGRVGLLFEGGEYTPYDKIMLAVFHLDWFHEEEPDLDQLLFSDGSLTPAFRGDIGTYTLALYEGTERLTVTPVTSNGRIAITVNGQPAAANRPTTVELAGLDAISVEAKLNGKIRRYEIRLDRERPAPQLLLHWDFEQSLGGEVVDVSGNGHNGLLKNGAEVRPGEYGGALYLNGERAHVEVLNPEGLHPGKDSFTFAVWIRPDELVRQRHIMYWYGSNGKVPQWWTSVEQSGAVRINMFGQPAGREIGVATAAGMVTAGEWTHVAVVRDRDVNKIYVNGRLAATSVKYDGDAMDLTNLDAPPPLVGYDKGTVSNRDWKGYMDDLRIYRYALHDADIDKLYRERAAVPPVTRASVASSAPGGRNGWHLSDVTVTLVAEAGSAPVERTEYRLNGGAWQRYDGPFPIAEDGVHELAYRSIDTDQREEEIRTLIVKIDKTAPQVAVSPDPAELWPPNGKMVPVTMRLDAVDHESGIASVRLEEIVVRDGDDGPRPASDDDVRGAEFGTDDRDFSLRSTRNGRGDGRTYTIRYVVEDKAGHRTEAVAEVVVPHDRSGKPR